MAEFSKEIAADVNSNGREGLRSSVEDFVGFSVTEAKLKRLDRFGIDLLCTAGGRKAFPCRLPFPAPAVTKDEVLHQIDQLCHLDISRVLMDASV